MVRDKEFEARMQGMIYAANLDGIIKVLNSNGYSDAAMFLQNKKVEG